MRKTKSKHQSKISVEKLHCRFKLGHPKSKTTKATVTALKKFQWFLV